jgi:hypothetical protein
LENAVLSLSDRNIGHDHHIYLDSFDNSVRSAEIWLDRKALVGLTGVIPPDLELEPNT